MSAKKTEKNSQELDHKKQEEKWVANYIKTRDDVKIVSFEATNDGKIRKIEASECSWLGEGDELTPKLLRQRIEPWLSSLFQSEHLSLLAGSGLTHAVSYLAVGGKAAGMEAPAFTGFNSAITSEAESSAKKAGREKANFEDIIRVANELLRGLIILGYEPDSKFGLEPLLESDSLYVEIEKHIRRFAEQILIAENNIACADEAKRMIAFNTLINFLMSFASRSGTRDRLNIFTTNYDRLIEAGAEFAGLHLLDRFLGNLMPIFRSSRLDLDMHYNPPGIRGEPRYLEGVARLTKLHGSVDWVQTGKDIRRIGLPFGAESVDHYLKTPALRGADALKLMIYPNSAKDRETSFYPYVELFRDFAAAVCRPNSALVTFGYSFGDEHINRVIEDMLTIPSTHLVIISYDDPQGRIQKTFDDIGRPSQISLLIGNHLGNLKTLTDNYLPKSAIDKNTLRMSELIQRRLGAEKNEHSNEGKKPSIEPTMEDLLS